MSTIKDYLNANTANIISELPQKFSTRQFIWKLADKYEIDYVEMLICAYNDKTNNPRIFHNLHSQIGRYLLNNQNKLNIVILDERETDTNPFGRETETQLWKKR